MLIKPKRMSFLDSFVCRWSPKCFSYSLVSSFKLNMFCLEGPSGLYGSDPLSPGTFGSIFPWVNTHRFVRPGRIALFLWGGASIGLLSLQYSFFTDITLRDTMICYLQRVCSYQICQRRVSPVPERFFFLVLLLGLGFLVNLPLP